MELTLLVLDASTHKISNQDGSYIRFPHILVMQGAWPNDHDVVAKLQLENLGITDDKY